LPVGIISNIYAAQIARHRPLSLVAQHLQHICNAWAGIAYSLPFFYIPWYTGIILKKIPDVHAEFHQGIGFCG
jgi:hypothetical protein